MGDATNVPLTDEKLDEMFKLAQFSCVYRRDIERLIAQAREANRLRDELAAKSRQWVDVSEPAIFPQTPARANDKR